MRTTGFGPSSCGTGTISDHLLSSKSAISLPHCTEREVVNEKVKEKGDPRVCYGLRLFEKLTVSRKSKSEIVGTVVVHFLVMASMSTTVVNPEHFAPITETEEKELRRVFEQLSDYAIKAPFLKERENLEKWLAENKSKSHGVSEDLVIETTRRLEEINAEIRKYEAVPYNDKNRKISTADVLEKMQELKLARPRRRETEESDGAGDSARVKKVSRRGVEEMVWEVDENLDGFLDWQEFKLMFNRNITDRTGLEPSRMVRFITET